MPVIVPLVQGFEETEAIATIDLLRRADLNVRTVSLKDEFVTGSHGITIRPDSLLKEMKEEARAIVLPGGMPGTRNLASSNEIIDLVRDINGRNLLVAAICAAPTVLSKAGILKDREFTCYEGYEKEIPEGKHKKEPVVCDGNIITSRGLGTAIDFSLSIIEYLCDREKSEEIAKGILYLK